jgi:hypothetical protein
MLLAQKLSRSATTLDQLALQDFIHAANQALWRDWLSRLIRKNNNLLPFDQVRQHISFKGQHQRGLYAVPLDKIVGSVNRYLDFDRAFFPRQGRTRNRWLSINKAYYRDIALPPVELLKVGEMYFVSDGHHRISVARARGQEFVDASVTEIDSAAPIETTMRKADFSHLVLPRWLKTVCGALSGAL